MGEIRNAVRVLRATPIVSAVAVLSLALGIGANTAMFSILDSLLLRALPVREPRRLVKLEQTSSTGQSWTYAIWDALRARPQLFDTALAYSYWRFNLSSTGQTDFVDGVWTSGSFFEALGIPPRLGRTLRAADDARGGGPDGPVAVISHDFWQRRFGGDVGVVGRLLTVQGVAFTIAGVTPRDFSGPEIGRKFDVAVPIGTEPLMRGTESWVDRRTSWWLTIVLRLRPSQSMADAEAALRSVQPQIRLDTMPTELREDDRATHLATAWTLRSAAMGDSYVRRRYQRPLTTIMAVVVLVLVVACANIVNLLLARATARRHEMSVRIALGASRWRLVRQLLTESLLLSTIGAALALLFAQWFSRLLIGQLSTGTAIVYLDLTLNWRILGFTATVSLLTALLFGTLPALRASRAHPSDAIKEHGRNAGGDGRFRFGNVLVVAQVALSLVLIVAAGLFTRTFATLATRDLGFDRDAVLIATINAQTLQLPAETRRHLWPQFRAAASAVPGVAAASVSAVTPLSSSMWKNDIELVDGTRIALADRSTLINMIGPAWFDTYGTRVLAGRDFTDGDVEGSAFVAIVNEAFARKFLNGANPVGHRLRQPLRPTARVPDMEIVGMVADAAYLSAREPVPPTLYVPFGQIEVPPSSTSLSVRAASGAPALLARALASALTAVNPNVAISLRPLSQQVNAQFTQERLLATLSGFFGGLALLLAGLGLYGVTSYTVSRRRAEIGIRLALGAAPGGVVTMVLTRVLLLVSIGIALGAGASWWASQYVTTLLYDLPPRDPLTLIGSAVVLATTGALAGWLPARRAARIDPSHLLRP
jgi:putative ABC transport system permease protein